MKKILIFSTAYFPFVGGAEVAVKEITHRLSSKEFSSKGGPVFGWDMITARMDRKLPKIESVGNVNVYRVGIGWPIFDKYLLAFQGHNFAQKLHKKNQYSIVWSIMASYGGFAAMFFKKKNKEVPFLLTLQEGDDLEHIRRRVGFMKRRFKQIFNSADYIQCISNYLADWAKEIGAERSIEVVPNGVDIKKFSIFNRRFSIADFRKELGIAENEKIIITASRLVKKNGIDDLIRAINELRVMNHELRIKLLICGTGEDEKKLKNLAKNLGVEHRVLFLGHVPHDDLPKYLWISDVFCRPSLSEGLGNSFLEAMAAGLPVIGAAVGGIPDFLVDCETGWFCKAKDQKSIAEKIKYILDDKNKEEVEQVIKNAKELVEKKYNWDSIVQKFKKIFKFMNRFAA